MLRRSARLRRPAVVAIVLGGASAVAALAPAAALAAGATQQRDGQATYDVRSSVVSGGAPAAASGPAGAAAAARGANAQALAGSLGPQGVVQLDAATGTPRRLTRTDGALTGPSAAAPAQVALAWVRRHSGVFGLDARELTALGTPRQSTSPAGVRHLRWSQSYRGIPVLGAGLRAAVDADGRLISLAGAPLADTAVTSTTPRVAKPSALARARRDAGAAASATPGASTGDAELVIFAGHDGPRLAWKVAVDADSTHRYQYVLDADSGAILTRSNLVRFASGGATGVWAYAPSDGAAPNPLFGDGRDGVPAWRPQERVFGDGWITSDGSTLEGENAHVYSDIDDDDAAGTLEEIPSNATTVDDLPLWDYGFDPISAVAAPGWPTCLPTYPCSWRAFAPQNATVGWQRNRAQNAVQVFWFLNSFKEHLEAAPIGFDAASGDFSGDDPVIANTDDGADSTISFTDGSSIPHHPDPDHLNNANMYTPADGSSPRMQMYLFTGDGDTPDANGGDDAAIVFHEYTHGLSSRLVTDEAGDQALNAPQSGAMGEAWSDWYALDYLAGEGWQLDDPAVDGEVVLASYISAGRTGSLREAALDCPAGPSTAPTCADHGFTYADYGKVISGYGPEVHADGEIWAQTLWDLRAAVGVEAARLLVTEGMRLAPAEPSFLDMRDAILAANVADTASDEPTRAAREQQLWEVFARRGMGYYAQTLDAWDPAPLADFATPPAGDDGTALLSGTVTDADSGAPLAGATVQLPGSSAPAGVQSDAAGHWEIPAALAGVTYPRLTATADGYEAASAGAVTVAADGTTVVALRARRDWALHSGGATVDFSASSGPDLTALGCGPEYATDGTLAYGWGSYQPDYDGSAHAAYGMPVVARGVRTLVLRLPAAVDVSSVRIDPGAVCGDDDSAALGAFSVETSADGASWRTASNGAFGRAHNHRLNAVAINAGTGTGVSFVRVTMIRPQGGAGSSETYFMDMAELSVLGTPARAVGPDPDPDDPGRDPDPIDPGPPSPPDPPGPGPVIDVPNPGPGPLTPQPQPQPQPGAPTVDVARPVLSNVAVVLPRRGSLKTLLSASGLPLRLRADERVTAIVTITLPAATARRLRLTRQRRGTVAIARLSNAAVSAGRTTTLRVRLPRNTRIWLQRRAPARLRFGVAILATDRAGNVATKQLSATARR